MAKQLAHIAAAGNRLAALKVLRDRLAQEIDDCTYARDLPALILRFTAVLAEIDDMPGSQPLSKADEIAERRRQRRAQPGA